MRFMNLYFALLPVELKMKIIQYVIDRFKIIYKRYNIHPSKLVYSPCKRTLCFYNDYCIVDNGFPSAINANIGDIITRDYPVYKHIYTVVGYFDYLYYKNVVLERDKIVYTKDMLTHKRYFLLVVKDNLTIDISLKPYIGYSIIHVMI